MLLQTRLLFISYWYFSTTCIYVTVEIRTMVNKFDWQIITESFIFISWQRLYFSSKVNKGNFTCFHNKRLWKRINQYLLTFEQKCNICWCVNIKTMKFLQLLRSLFIFLKQHKNITWYPINRSLTCSILIDSSHIVTQQVFPCWDLRVWEDE